MRIHGGSEFWAWRDEVMRHPEGRARRGDTCVWCGGAIPGDAHWKHRDRHVCGKKCNRALSNRFGRWLRAGRLKPPARARLRTHEGPAVFGPSEDPDRPFEFDGYGPLAGDSVIRFGSVTSYSMETVPSSTAGEVFVAHHGDSGATATYGSDGEGGATIVCFGRSDGRGNRVEEGQVFVGADGGEYIWIREMIRDVTDDGLSYTWTAPVCVPATAPSLRPLWTKRLQRHSEELRDTTQTFGRHARRTADPGLAERFGSKEIFDRDGWSCGICGEAISPDLSWPDPASASIDHIVPVSVGGEHTRENCRAAHLRCNIVRGGG